MQTMNSQPTVDVKGSWEDLLQQANDFAAVDNDQCIPLWQKVSDRLSKLTNAQLDAGEGHLRKLRLIAASNLQQYFVSRQRYDEAIQVIERLEKEIDPEDGEQWQKAAIETLVIAGRNEQAIERAKQSAQAAPADDVDTWGSLVYTALALKEFPAAEEALREIERRINRARKAEGIAATKEDSAYLSWLRANYALEQGLWDEAIAWWTHASTQDKYYDGEVYNLYIKLLRAGQAAKALQLIERDKANQVRADFWRGLAMSRLGKEKDGQQYWHRAASVDVNTNEDLRYALTEYFLAHYYLPELRDQGLAANLTLIREVEGLDWHFHYLAALGFALRNDLDNAQIHLTEAVTRHRRAGLGARLRHETWFPFADLLESSAQNELKKYFNL